MIPFVLVWQNIFNYIYAVFFPNIFIIFYIYIQHILYNIEKKAAVARCTHASKPLNRDCASTIPCKANPLTQHLILTYLAVLARFQLAGLSTQWISSPRRYEHFGTAPFLLIHEIGKLLCQFEIYVSFADIFNEILHFTNGHSIFHVFFCRC